MAEVLVGVLVKMKCRRCGCKALAETVDIAKQHMLYHDKFNDGSGSMSRSCVAARSELEWEAIPYVNVKVGGWT